MRSRRRIARVRPILDLLNIGFRELFWCGHPPWRSDVDERIGAGSVLESSVCPMRHLALSAIDPHGWYGKMKPCRSQFQDLSKKFLGLNASLSSKIFGMTWRSCVRDCSYWIYYLTCLSRIASQKTTHCPQSLFHSSKISQVYLGRL